jgi:anti-sigma28 factor (negative regulator of flagellin synthesis)
MRINDYRLTGSNTGQTERTNETGDAGSLSSTRSQGRERDRVEVSSFAGRLSQALTAESQRKQARVEQLAALFEVGKLDSDPARLSRKLVDSMLGASPSVIARQLRLGQLAARDLQTAHICWSDSRLLRGGSGYGGASGRCWFVARNGRVRELVRVTTCRTCFPH